MSQLDVSYFYHFYSKIILHADTSRVNLFLLTYLMFPVNVLIGVLLGVWRLIVTSLFNIVHMGRMDISLLNRNVEPFDPG